MGITIHEFYRGVFNFLSVSLFHRKQIIYLKKIRKDWEFILDLIAKKEVFTKGIHLGFLTNLKLLFSC